MSFRGYSLDLRTRVLSAVQDGMTQDEAADVFSVGVATVYRWVRLHRETGSLEPRPHGGGPEPVLSDQDHQLLKKLIEEKPDRTILELTNLTNQRTQNQASTSSVYRAIKRLGLTLKKKR